jgi:hypothetical protein
VHQDLEWVLQCIARLGRSIDSVCWDQDLTELRRDLERLGRIDAYMCAELCVVFMVPLGLMALIAPTGPDWIAALWVIPVGAIYVRWMVVILRYEKALLEGRGWGGHTAGDPGQSTSSDDPSIRTVRMLDRFK